MVPRSLLVSPLLLAVAAGGGCFGKRNFATEGDALRASVVELESENAALTRRVAELEAELEAAATTSGSLSEEVRAAIPHPVEITLSRLCHAVDSDDDGSPDLLRLYLTPLDGRGRFVPLVGNLTVVAALLPADADAMTVGRCALNPVEVRDAYRSGITGTHYSIECPLAVPPGASEQELVVQVTFEDAQSGRSLTAQHAVAMRP